MTARRLYPVEIARESDGATLIGTSRRDVPLVSVTLECNGGHSCDPLHTPGLADLTAALFNEGSQRQPPLEWHRRLENDAISMALYPAARRWMAHLNCLSSDLPRALDLFAEWLIRPGLPVGEWKRLVKGFRADAREQWAQPIGVIDALSNVQVLGYGHPMAHPPFEKGFARARYEDACRLGRSVFRQGKEVYGMIGGDIDLDQGFARLRDLIAGLPPGKSPLTDEPPPNPAQKRVWILDHPRLNQVYFALARPGSRAGEPDRLALRLADYALGGGGFSSRLVQRIRSDMGHTYSIHSSLPLDQVLGPFQIQSFTQTENLEPMLDLIQDELEAVRSRGFTPEEVEEARRHLHRALPLQLTSPDVVLRVVADGLLAGLEVEDLEADWHALRTTAFEQVNQAAQRLIGDNTFHLALIGPARAIQSRIENCGPAAVFPFRTPPDRWQDRG